MTWAYTKTSSVTGRTVNTTSGSTSVTVSSNASIQIGMMIEGAGIPAETVVAGISGTTLTLNQAATATATGVAVTFFTETLTQTGTDANLSTLATATNMPASMLTRPATVAATYLVNRGRLAISGTLTITGRIERLVMTSTTMRESTITINSTGVLNLDGRGGWGSPQVGQLGLTCIESGHMAGGFSGYMFQGTGALNMANATIVTGQSISNQPKYTITGTCRLVSLQQAGNSNGPLFEPNTATLSYGTDGRIALVGGWRFAPTRSGWTQTSPYLNIGRWDFEGIGSLQLIYRLIIEDAALNNSQGSGVALRGSTQVIMRNAAAGSSIGVGVFAGGTTSDNKGICIPTRMVSHTAQSSTGAALQNAVIYTQDVLDGSEGDPTAWVKNGTDDGEYDGRAKRTYVWQTDAAGAATAQEIYLAYIYTPDGNSANLKRNVRTLSGGSGNDRLPFVAWQYGSLSGASEVALRGIAELSQGWQLLPDANVTLSETAAGALTSIATLDDLYDAAKHWKTRPLAARIEYPSTTTQPVSANGTVLSLGSLNLRLDASAADAFSIDTATNTITIKAGVLQVGAKFKSIVTSGSITFAGSESINAVYTSAAGTRVVIAERSGRPLSTYVTINGVPVGGTVVDGAFRAGFVPLATTRAINVQPTDQVRIAASYYGSKPAVFNILGSDIASFTLSLDVEPAIDTTVDTTKRDAIAASFDTVVNGSQVELTVNKTLSQYTPGEVVAGFSYYVASRGFVIAQSIVFANSADFYALSTGTLTVYNPDFKFRLSDLDSTGAAITPTADGYAIPLVLQYVNPATGAKSHMTLLNASGALLGTAQWPQSQASVGDADQSAIAARTKAAIETSTVIAKEATVSGRPTLAQIESSAVLAKTADINEVKGTGFIANTHSLVNIKNTADLAVAVSA